MRSCVKKGICALLIALLLCLTAIPAMAGSATLAVSGGKYIVTASSLNVRAGAGMDYMVVARARKGSTVTYVSSEGGWWYVRLSNGMTGYVDKKYLTTGNAAKTGTYTVTASKLNVRAKPNTAASRVGSLTAGTIVQISEMNGDWGYATAGKTSGWVALAYLKSGSSGAKPASKISVGSSYMVIANRLNVRKSGSTSAAIITTLPQGTLVRVSKVSGGWAYVSYMSGKNIREGWVSTSYLG